MPTVLQRQGIFTEAIGGRVPMIFDPATTQSNPAAARPAPVRRQHDPCRSDRSRGAASCSRAIPLPTSAGTANNYRRLDNETVDQDQFSVRIDHRFPGNNDQVFGRLTRFHENFIPVTPLPDGSGVADRHARPAEDDRVVVRVQLSAHLLEHASERAAHRRHAPRGRTDGGAAEHVGVGRR